MNADIKDKVFEFVFEMAFRDAVLRNAFTNPYKKSPYSMTEKEAEDKFRELKKSIREITKPIAADYIKAILEWHEGDKPDPIEYIRRVWVAVRCEKTEEYGDAVSGFTFGNAQKLINMTAKYMFITCFDKPELECNFENCHCPMDGIMVEIVKKKTKKFAKIEGKECIALNDDMSWSTLDYKEGDLDNPPDNYNTFQEAVKILAEAEGIKRIEYDYKYWE